MEWVVAFGGVLLSAITYILGRAFNESEKILAEKRRIYEEFLRACPVPNDAYDSLSEEEQVERVKKIGRIFPIVTLYASPNVALAVSRYLKTFEEASNVLGPFSHALHEAFGKAAKAHNDIILEMNRDAFGWSVFGYKGPSRLPKDALYQASSETL